MKGVTNEKNTYRLADSPYNDSPDGSSLSAHKPIVPDERYIMASDNRRDPDVELGTYGMSFYPGARPGGIPNGNGNNTGRPLQDQTNNAVAEVSDPDDVFMVDGMRQHDTDNHTAPRQNGNGRPVGNGVNDQLVSDI